MSLDAIAELWRQPELSLSTIGNRLGLSRGQVVGKIDRARKGAIRAFSQGRRRTSSNLRARRSGIVAAFRTRLRAKPG